MSFAARNALRTALRARRNYTTVTGQGNPAALEKFIAEDKALTHHAAQTTELWRKISYFVCIPGIAVCAAWVYNAEAEHAAHIEHLKHENGGELPETPAYDFLNRRSKPFPWGMNSLFFNEHVNKNMEEA